ncbi:hypothetical protein Cus16_2847 [Curtobacterium sp. ER1/6]|nr:hypothetical protein Cus16_2847 [Curtobacterium sp. ER1/6]
MLVGVRRSGHGSSRGGATALRRVLGTDRAGRYPEHGSPGLPRHHPQ